MLHQFLTVMFAAALVLSLPPLSQAVDQGAGQPDAILKAIEAKLQPILKTLELSPTSDYKKSDLIIGYRTQKLMVHVIKFSGEITPELREETGPSYQGFILNIRLQPARELNALKMPATMQKPYWQTYMNVSQIKETEKKVLWSLSYGSRTDEKLLAKIRDVMEGLSK